MRWLGTLRSEDGVLAAWNVAGIPLLARSPLGPMLELGDAPNAAAGIVQLLAAIGAIVAIASRPAGAQPGAEPGPTGAVVMVYIGPLIGGIAFVAGSASSYLGAEVDGLITGVAFLAAVAAMAFANHLPVLDVDVRRLLVLPFILVCAGIFNGFAADILEGFDPRLLSLESFSAEGGLVLFIGLMLLGGLAAFYAALVAAPRALADPEHAGFLPIGFAVYVVSALLGIGWLAGGTLLA
jgi:hypothetical protein